MEGLDDNRCFKLGYVLSSPVENSHCFTPSVQGLEYGTVVRQTSVNNPFTKGSAPGSISYETMSIRDQQPRTIFKVWGCQVHENKDCKKNITVRVHGSLM